MSSLTLRLITLNLGGGVKNFMGPPEQSAAKIEAINTLINQVKPDLVACQEIAQYIDADGNMHSMVDQIRDGSGFDQAYYGETLSIKRHMQIKKDVMIRAIFNDWWDWSKGNALFSRIPFCRLSDATKGGVPRNVPIFQPIVYEGSRNTDPRYVILSRLKTAPYPYVLNLHLSTLTGERGANAWQDAIDAAESTRQQQVARILGLIEEAVLQEKKPVIMLGDFNARPDEYCLKGMLEEEKSFVRLKPVPDLETHGRAGQLDHIFFSPRERLISYKAQVIDNKLTRSLSDHLPVVADLEIE